MMRQKIKNVKNDECLCKKYKYKNHTLGTF